MMRALLARFWRDGDVTDEGLTLAGLGVIVAILARLVL